MQFSCRKRCEPSPPGNSERITNFYYGKRHATVNQYAGLYEENSQNCAIYFAMTSAKIARVGLAHHVRRAGSENHVRYGLILSGVAGRAPPCRLPVRNSDTVSLAHGNSSSWFCGSAVLLKI